MLWKNSSLLLCKLAGRPTLFEVSLKHFYSEALWPCLMGMPVVAAREHDCKRVYDAIPIAFLGSSCASTLINKSTGPATEPGSHLATYFCYCFCSNAAMQPKPWMQSKTLDSRNQKSLQGASLISRLTETCNPPSVRNTSTQLCLFLGSEHQDHLTEKVRTPFAYQILDLLLPPFSSI